MSLRILFVTNLYPTPGHPGDSPVIAQQRAALEADGHQVDLLYFDSTRSRRAYLGAVARLLRRAHRGPRYDVVHAHYGFLCGWVARCQWRSPVVVTFRGSDVFDPRERPWSRALARRIDAAVVMTEEMAQVLGRPDAHVVPYGIDTAVFRPGDRQAARRTLGLPPEEGLVLFPYDPTRPEKRFDLIEAAMERVAAARPAGARLLTVHGRTPAELATHMQACDALVLASDTEGSPVAVREALACRLPVVSVDVGDVAEVLAGTSGSLVVERDPASIADGLLTVLAERPRPAPPESAGLGCDSSARLLVQLYEHLVAEPQPALSVKGH